MQATADQAGRIGARRVPARVHGGQLAPGTFAVMDLLEVAAGPNHMVTFDGRLLEVFGGSVRRFHVKLLAVTGSDPDKHGTATSSSARRAQRIPPGR